METPLWTDTYAPDIDDLPQRLSHRVESNPEHPRGYQGALILSKLLI